MRISDRYLGKQVLLGTVYAVFILSVVLVLGRLFQESRALLVDQKAPALLLFRYMLSILPYSLMFTLPWGFLTAVLLVFGRLSTDHEITSFRVAGMSLFRVGLPVFVVGAAFSGICLYLNVNVVPLAKASSAELVMEHVKKDPRSLLDPGRVQAQLKGGKKLFVEDKDGDDALVGFHFYQLKDKKEKEKEDGLERAYVHATRASLVVDKEKQQIRLRLLDAYGLAKQTDGSETEWFSGAAEPLVLPYEWSMPRTRPNSMTNAEIRAKLKANVWERKEKPVDFSSEITRRYSFSMACFAFAFIAVPLGLKSRRKDTSTGLIVSLLLGAGYFLFSVVAGEVKTDTGRTFVLWLPNVLCILAGLFLFRRARFK
jgi:lipopolysaccharide export LptBFGC system permease protein LptF